MSVLSSRFPSSMLTSVQKDTSRHKEVYLGFCSKLMEKLRTKNENLYCSLTTEPHSLDLSLPILSFGF